MAWLFLGYAVEWLCRYDERNELMAYVYTLEDLYKIFQQAEDKVAQLKEFQALNLEYHINWDRLIEVWS